MAKQIRRAPFSTPAKKHALCLSFDIVADWLATKADGQSLAGKARSLSMAFANCADPVWLLMRSATQRDTLTEVMLAVDAVKKRPEGDADRNFKPLRMADRRILQLCEDVVSNGGSFNCARPEISFACLALPASSRD